MTNCIIPFCISYTINQNQALMAYPLFWQIPPFSRNDKTYVLRGNKMGRLRRPTLFPYPI